MSALRFGISPEIDPGSVDGDEQAQLALFVRTSAMST
jgi:hypothetical protein